MSVTPTVTLQDHAATNPNGLAFIADDESWTYERLVVDAQRLARGFARRGIRRGDRIVLHMPNRPELVVAIYACLRIGAIAVPLNSRSKTAELTPLLKRLQPALYIGHADLYTQVSPIESSILPPERRFITGSAKKDTLVQPWANLLSDVWAVVPVESDIQSPAVLLATSGTTGVSKFVIHTKATLASIY